MMVSNKFRHLPVLDSDGAEIGLLDIAKCLYDAISALERYHCADNGGQGKDPSSDAFEALLKKASEKGKGKSAVQLQQMQQMQVSS